MLSSCFEIRSFWAYFEAQFLFEKVPGKPVNNWDFELIVDSLGLDLFRCQLQREPCLSCLLHTITSAQLLYT